MRSASMGRLLEVSFFWVDVFRAPGLCISNETEGGGYMETSTGFGQFRNQVLHKDRGSEARAVTSNMHESTIEDMELLMMSSYLSCC